MSQGESCPECGEAIESSADLETETVPEIEVEDDGSFDLYGNTDLYLCKGCKKPMGVGRS